MKSGFMALMRSLTSRRVAGGACCEIPARTLPRNIIQTSRWKQATQLDHAADQKQSRGSVSATRPLTGRFTRRFTIFFALTLPPFHYQ